MHRIGCGSRCCRGGSPYPFGKEKEKMNSIMLNSMLLDAAPPLGFITLFFAIIAVPIIILLIVFAAWLVKKAVAKNKRNASVDNGSSASAQTGREEK